MAIKNCDFELTARQTGVINAIRCLLVLLVVMIHVLPNQDNVLDYRDFPSFSFSFVTELLSHNLARIAVPCFFVFSGYFFFYSFDGILTTKWYGGKLKKRLRTLLVPYLIWNLLIIGIVLLKNCVLFPGGEKDDFFNRFVELGVYGLMWGRPANLPLWYMRDLLCMSLLSPVFHLLFRYLKGFGLLLLAVPYYLMVDTGIPGLGSVSILFFGVGAYLAINRINLISFSNKFGKAGLCAALILLLAAVFLSGKAAHEIVIRVFIPFGIVSLINLACRMGECTVNLLSGFAACSFFVYAAHWIYIRNWSNGLAVHLFGSGMSGRWLSYFFSPLFTVLVCAAVFFVMKKFMPKTLRLIDGGRI